MIILDCFYFLFFAMKIIDVTLVCYMVFNFCLEFVQILCCFPFDFVGLRGIGS